MDYLYAPWRDEYIKKEQKGCPFCYIVDNPEKDEECQVLYRSENCFLVMNKYPYTSGHFMVIPNIHVESIELLDGDIWLEMSNLVQKSVKILKEDLGAHGINIGMNLGECGGAGIPDHVHYHLVPRWPRDTNFITTIGETRVFSTDSNKIYKKLKDIINEKF
ncbi:HIT family protein [Sulfurospirillum arcachonense]|uniref:HIT family protein n=1 Tax=Sulfurospirillum arcachonense TaxID=57666 RepID=UPI00046995CA|nr:HIT domain-containing protein [Sulfurospirillum arcachonense]